MRSLSRYLADTYAFIEAVGANPRYVRILSSGGVVTTAMNVLELHYALTQGGLSPLEADAVARSALRLVAEVPPEVALEASKTRLRVNGQLRATRSKARLSYIDAWGYEAARALGLRFLTGDPPFQRLPGVEFVR